SVDFDGLYYQAHTQTGVSLDVPVMASALRRRSFELCGMEADGAISWVCPVQYLRDVAMPAMQAGAERAGRPVPPLIAHVPVCIHNNVEEVRAAVREQLGNYPLNPFYTQMFVEAGFPEVVDVKGWSDKMIEAVVFAGESGYVKERLLEMFSLGVKEVLVSPVLVGPDQEASMQRTLQLIAEVSESL
ncbi:LLM class flavin-dependent oxidoreductase, partial [Dehalococcoidia bacterium]|nr:LLM class flavin-dependent oxidoreductase [Dehalococcoidia bacterium]